jgi:acetylornithine deacetylase
MTPSASLLAELVAIESVNPSLAGDGRGEAAIATFCAAWLERHGFEVQRLERHPGRPSIVGVARGSGGGRSLMLNGHIDTVGIAGYEGDPLDPTIRDGRMHGRGTYDMKSGVAAAMVAAAQAARGGELRGDLIVALVADEEHASLGTAEVLERFRTDGAIVCEPTGLDVVGAHKGFAWFDVEITGRAAHGSLPDQGVDAIVKAGHFLVELDRLAQRLAAGPGHLLLGPGSVHAGVISGGVESSTYPERCRMTVERRTVPGETADGVETELAAILTDLRTRVPGFEAALERGLVRDPWEADRDAPVYRAVLAHATTAVGRPPLERGVGYWADTQLLAAAGIPALLFGVAGAGAHATTEWVDLASLEVVTQVLVSTIVDVCG